LESAVRYTAAEWVRKASAPTQSLLGLSAPSRQRDRHFDELLAAEAAAVPEHQLVDIDDVGALAAFLVSDGARQITGTIIPVDGGQHAIA